MGQQLGKPTFVPGVEPFLNLPSSSIKDLWESYTLLSDGWGLNEAALLSIIKRSGLASALGVDNSQVPEVAASFFRVLDTDKNGLVDALELLGTLIVVSSMNTSDKLKTAFELYDFNGLGSLTCDELALALQSTATGLCKITGHPIPGVESFDALASLIFTKLQEAHINSSGPSVGPSAEASGPSGGGDKASKDKSKGSKGSKSSKSNKSKDKESAASKEGGEGEGAGEGLFDESRVALFEVLRYCEADPTAASWVAYYDDLQTQLPGNARPIDVDRDIQVELNVAEKLRHLPSDDSAEAGPSPTIANAQAPTPAIADLPVWRQSAMKMRPSDPAVAKEIGSVPASELNLEWIYGYGAQESRANLFYSASGDIIYHAATAGIVYKKATEDRPLPWQEFNLEQRSEIVSLAISKDLATVATGGVGVSPVIVVWDASSTKTLSLLRGFHANAVTHLDFSADGQLLLSVGKDEDHSLAVYRWADHTRLFSARLDKDGVFDARFASAGYAFATCNASGVSFWLPKGGAENGAREWGRQKGVFGKKAPQPIVALSAFVQPTHMLAGTATGELLLWEGRSLVQSVSAHDGIITLISLHPPTSTLLTAAKDRKVKRWNTKLEPLVVIDLLLLSSSVDPLVRGASLSLDGKVLLLGTRGGEIFEVAAQNGPPPAEGDETEPLRAGVDLNNGALVAGHVKGRVHCLATHASGEMASGGQDGSLRTWDLASHRSKKMAGFDAPIACVAYSPADATLVALALGQGKEGTLILWGLEAAAEVATFRDTAGVINDVKISNDGSSLAAASEDGSVYLYKNEAGTWGLKGEMRGWAGGVKRVDFSADGQFLRGDSDLSENEDRPLRVFALETLEEVAALNSLRDSEWASETCLHTYGTQGLTLSPLQPKVGSVHKAAAAPLLVSASEGSGRLRLLSYPAVSGKGGAKAFAGHGGQISSVRFAPNDSHVLSAGERAVFQWALEVDEGNDSSDELEPEEVVEEEEEEDEEGRPIVKPPPESDTEEDLVDGAVLERPALVQAVRGQEWGPMLEMKEAAGEGLFGALKGFAPQALPKKGAVTATHKAPEDNLSLEWVYGYAGQGQRSNVAYNSQGHIVYPAASMGVVLDKVSWRQQHHLDVHSDAVSALALHPQGSIVATGQRGHKPSVAIWDSTTMTTLRVLVLGEGSRGVSALAFSPDGHTLAIASQDDEHSVWIYDWRAGVLKAKGEGGPSKVLCLCFSPDGRKLLQGGVGHFKLWTLKGRSLSGKAGLFGRSGGRRPTILSVAWHMNEGLLGAANGNLLRLEGRKVSSAVPTHKKAVTSLFPFETPEGPCVVSGGMDGMVKILDGELSPIEEREFKVPAGADAMSGQARGVRSVWRNKDGRKLLVGTNGGDIWELSATDGSVMNGGPLVSGHWKHDLRGLAAHPVREEFATVGGDRMLRLWDMATRRQLNALNVGEMGRCVAFAPNGLFAAVGVGGEEGKPRQADGSVLVVSLMESALRVVTRKQDTNQAMSVVKFSPNGQVLAAACLDGHVYLYDVLNNFKLKAKTTDSLGPITHLDISLDSACFVVNSAKEEVACFNLKTGERVQGPIPEPSKLATWTCRLGAAVVGIYRDLETTENVGALAASPDGGLLAVGDGFGQVRLLSFPCPTVGASAKVYRGHGAPIANVAFSVEGQFLLSVGCQDRSVLQWRRENNIPPTPDKSGEEKVDVEVAGPLLSLDISPPAPTPSSSQSTLPGPNVVLEGVIGVSQRGLRRNLAYTPSGGLLHALGKWAVVCPPGGSAGGGAPQVLYAHHGQEIGALVLSPDGRFVASGERGPSPATHIWDPATGRRLAILPLAHGGDVKLLAFSGDGKTLASVGLNGPRGSGAGDHSLAVFGSASGGWEDARLLATADLDHRLPLCLAFLHTSDTQLMTGGSGHAVFWTLRGQSLSWVRGSWGKGRPQVLLTAVPVAATSSQPASLVTGTQSGSLLCWRNGEVVSSVGAHEGGPVVALSGARGGEVLLSGGKDGVVKMWKGQDLIQLKAYVLSQSVTPPPLSTVVRSVCMDGHGTRLAVGLAGDEVYEVGVDNGQGLRLLEGVTGGGGARKAELLAASPHPTNPDEYALIVAGDVVRLMSAAGHKERKSAFVRHAGDVLGYSTGGGLIAVARGTRATVKEEYAGSVVILKASDLKEVARVQDVSRTYVTSLCFSPDDSSLAVVYADGSLVCYDTSTWGKRWVAGPRKPDGTYRASFDATGALVRARTAAQGPIPHFVADAASGTPVAQAPEGTVWVDQSSPIVVTVQPSGAVHVALRDAPAGAFTVLLGNTTPPRATMVLADNSHVLTFGAEDGTVMSYRVML